MTRTCYGCGEVGHLSRDCPSGSSGGAPSAPVIIPHTASLFQIRIKTISLSHYRTITLTPSDIPIHNFNTNPTHYGTITLTHFNTELLPHPYPLPNYNHNHNHYRTITLTPWSNYYNNPTLRRAAAIIAAKLGIWPVIARTLNWGRWNLAWNLAKGGPRYHTFAIFSGIPVCLTFFCCVFLFGIFYYAC